MKGCCYDRTKFNFRAAIRYVYLALITLRDDTQAVTFD